MFVYSGFSSPNSPVRCGFLTLLVEVLWADYGTGLGRHVGGILIRGLVSLFGKYGLVFAILPLSVSSIVKALWLGCLVLGGYVSSLLFGAPDSC